uniref:Transmembrane protein 164 n=1 Tax=Plectus sambesii TaxID=2011161 RepID=A0A914X738_9BILA
MRVLSMFTSSSYSLSSEQRRLSLFKAAGWLRSSAIGGLRVGPLQCGRTDRLERSMAGRRVEHIDSPRPLARPSPPRAASRRRRLPPAPVDRWRHLDLAPVGRPPASVSASVGMTCRHYYLCQLLKAICRLVCLRTRAEPVGVMFADILVAGVNHSIEGNGGPQCANYIPLWQRLLETAFMVPLGAYGIAWSWPQLIAPKTFVINQRVHRYRYLILAAYCVVFGAELGFKFASQTAIFLLNPCHIATMLQLLLLMLDPSNELTCRTFRFHMYTLPGALLALAFPVLNTRSLPGEILVYYIQHIFILFIPVYLMNLGGAYSTEPVTNLSWPVFSLSLILLYHYIPLQFFGMMAHVNLNCIICPAISDPFKGRLWRLMGVAHQTLYIPLHTKLYSILARSILRYMRLLSPDPPPSGASNGAALRSDTEKIE